MRADNTGPSGGIFTRDISTDLWIVAGTWLGLGAVQVYLSIAVGQPISSWQEFATFHGMLALLWIALTFLIHAWSSHIARVESRGLLILLHVAGALVAAIIATFVRRRLEYWLTGANVVNFGSTLLFFADITAVSYIVAVFLGKVLDARNAVISQTKHELALRSQLAKAKLGYLQAQLQPHFLFNALGAVSELVFENPAAAIKTYKQLMSVLQFAAAHEADEIPLGQELTALTPYLDVQRTRFSDWLTISTVVDSSTDSLLVPSLLLQPLVENAIRHGLRNRTEAGEVTIVARRAEGKLHLEVRDNGRGLVAGHDMERRGLGLSNTRERLRTLYGDDATLTLREEAGGGTVASVSVPAREVSPDITDAPPVVQQPHRKPIRLHPALKLILGCLVAATLWTQQSYAYTVLRRRTAEYGLAEIARHDFAGVALWGLAIAIMFRLLKIFPIRRHPIGAGLFHVATGAILSYLHAVALAVAVGAETITPAMYRSSAIFTFLIYVLVMAYSQRRDLEEWLRQRQVATLRMNTDIAEARLKAATMRVPPAVLTKTLFELEASVWSDPGGAEMAIAALGNGLRSSMAYRSS